MRNEYITKTLTDFVNQGLTYWGLNGFELADAYQKLDEAELKYCISFFKRIDFNQKEVESKEKITEVFQKQIADSIYNSAYVQNIKKEHDEETKKLREEIRVLEINIEKLRPYKNYIEVRKELVKAKNEK